MERKKNAEFKGLARFCVVTAGMERTTFSKWDGTITCAEVREDRRGCPFAILDFLGIPGLTKQHQPGNPFYNPFMLKFIDYKSPAMRETNVWLWVVEQEKVPAVLKLYETIKFEYNIFQSTYVPAKTEGVVVNNNVKNKQVGR